MLPVLFGAIGLGAAALAASKSDDEDYGTVTLWMGGRGPRAGSGVASHLGGRTTRPYEYDVPSSTVANWTSGDIFGFMIPFFNIPIGPQSRVEHLTKKIDRAKGKIVELEKQLPKIKDDPAQLNRLATRIASLEASIEKWQDTRDKVETRMGAMYGAEAAQIPAQQLQTIEHLANRVITSAQKLRQRPNSRKAHSWLVDMVTSYDAMSGSISALRAQVSGSSVPAPTMVHASSMAHSPMSMPMYLAAPDYSVFGGLFSKKGAPKRTVDPSVKASVQRARQAAEEYKQVRAQVPQAVQPLEEAVVEWRVQIGQKFADKMRSEAPAVFGVLTKDDPEDEDEYGSDEFGLFGLGKKGREKRLRRRHARVTKKLEAAEEGSKKHDRLTRRLERIEGKMDKHGIEYGLFDDYGFYGLDDDERVDQDEIFGLEDVPLFG